MELHKTSPASQASEQFPEELTPDEKRGLAPPDYPVIEHYKGIDRTLLLENFKLTPEQRAAKFEDFMRFLEEVREARRNMREAGEQ